MDEHERDEVCKTLSALGSLRDIEGVTNLRVKVERKAWFNMTTQRSEQRPSLVVALWCWRGEEHGLAASFGEGLYLAKRVVEVVREKAARCG